MAINSCITTSYKEEIIQGIHSLADTYMVALYTSTASLDNTTAVYTTAGECSGGNYPAGGVVLPSASVVADTGVAILSFANALFTNLTIPNLRGCMVYNSSKANRTVAVFDFGGTQTLINSDLTLQVPAPTATTGLIRFN